MAGPSQETKEIDGTILLPEILAEIFHNFNVNDLSKVAGVNRLWNEAANREQTRRGPERTIISVSNGDVYDSISTKPYVALLFTAPHDLHYGVKNLQLDVLKKYKDRFPQYLVAVGVSHALMDEEHITCDGDLNEGGILSLMIPQYRDLKIRAKYHQHLSNQSTDQEFINNILPEDTHSKATFIMFARQTYNNFHLFELLKKSMDDRNQKFSLWGGAFDNAPFVAENGEIDKAIEEEFEEPMHGFGTQYNGIFAMSITGSSLESSSIVISCTSKKHEFVRKLTEFRDQLKLKRHRIGLVCGPDEVLDYSDDADLEDVYISYTEIMSAVKKIFSDIPFIGIWDNSCLDQFYGLKSKTDDPDQYLEHQMSVSLMVLTFD